MTITSPTPPKASRGHGRGLPCAHSSRGGCGRATIVVGVMVGCPVFVLLLIPGCRPCPRSSSAARWRVSASHPSSGSGLPTPRTLHHHPPFWPLCSQPHLAALPLRVSASDGIASWRQGIRGSRSTSGPLPAVVPPCLTGFIGSSLLHDQACSTRCPVEPRLVRRPK